jgi:hypothetical protein
MQMFAANRLPEPAGLIAELFGVERAEFLQHYFQKAPLRSQGSPRGAILRLLPDPNQIAELLALVADQPSYLRMTKEGAAYPAPLFAGGKLDLQGVWADYAAGSSINLNNLHKMHAGSKSISDRLVFELGHTVQANAYLSPLATAALAPHYDTHDVIVVQVFGSKSWKIFGSDHIPRFPSRFEPGLVDAQVQCGCLMELELLPGDSLYIPRGYPHHAEAGEGGSLHLTFGLMPISSAELLKVIIDMIELRESELRRHLSADLFRTSDIETDIERSATLLKEALADRKFVSSAVAAIRKDRLKVANLSPGLPIELAGRAVTSVMWRGECFSEVTVIETGGSVVTNGVKATNIAVQELEYFDRLRGGECIRRLSIDADCLSIFDGMIAKLNSLGLVIVN